MRNVFLPIIATASLVLFTACSSTGKQNEAGVVTDSKAQFDKAIKEAESAFKAVDQVGGGWAFTEEMIDEAKKAASANDYGKALQLAKEAYDQSIMAKQQHESQVNAGPTLF
jgi:hypothetical protein